MTRKIFALVMTLLLVLSLFGCASKPAETQPTVPPVETTVPPETTAPAETTPPPETRIPEEELDGLALYAAAKEQIENATNLIMTQYAQTIWTNPVEDGYDYYYEFEDITIYLQNIGTDALKVYVERTHEYREEIVRRSAEGRVVTSPENSVMIYEYYENGTVWMLCGETAYTTQMDAETYLSRFLPPLLIDETQYGDSRTGYVTNGLGEYRISTEYIDPVSFDPDLIPEFDDLGYYTMHATFHLDGSLEDTHYRVQHNIGAVEIYPRYTVSPEIPESLDLSFPFSIAPEDFTWVNPEDLPTAITFKSTGFPEK